MTDPIEHQDATLLTRHPPERPAPARPPQPHLVRHFWVIVIITVAATGMLVGWGLLQRDPGPVAGTVSEAYEAAITRNLQDRAVIQVAPRGPSKAYEAAITRRLQDQANLHATSRGVSEAYEAAITRNLRYRAGLR